MLRKKQHVSAANESIFEQFRNLAAWLRLEETRILFIILSSTEPRIVSEPYLLVITGIILKYKIFMLPCLQRLWVALSYLCFIRFLH